jgi:hypothetical protein
MKLKHYDSTAFLLSPRTSNLVLADVCYMGSTYDFKGIRLSRDIENWPQFGSMRWPDPISIGHADGNCRSWSSKNNTPFEWEEGDEIREPLRRFKCCEYQNSMGRCEIRGTINAPLKLVFDVYTQLDTWSWSDIRWLTWTDGKAMGTRQPDGI